MKEEANQKNYMRTTEEKIKFFFSYGQDIWYVKNSAKKKEKKKKTVMKETDEIKVIYTNIDGIIPRRLEMTGYLK